MPHYAFEDKPEYPIGLLVKDTNLPNTYALKTEYGQRFEACGVGLSDLVFLPAAYNDSGKAPVKFIKEHLDALKDHVKDLGIQYLYVADAAYFKVLTKNTKTEPHFGYILPGKYPGYEHLNIVLGVNHNALIYNPLLEEKLSVGMKAIAEHKDGSYQEIGKDIIKSAYYPSTPEDIKSSLEGLKRFPRLFMDIEGFSLSFFDAGIGTITACWEENGEIGHGIAFACDYSPLPFPSDNLDHGEFAPNPEVRKILREFFETYEGEVVWHYANYDVKAIVYALWAEHPLDIPNILKGVEVMCRNIHDTKIIAYLAINTVAEYSLGLKSLAQPFAGNWAIEEIKDIKKVPLEELLEYNLKDGISTHYVFNAYYPKMVEDAQEDIYKTLKIPSLMLLIYTEMIGLPMCDKAIAKAKEELQLIVETALDIINNSNYVKAAELITQTAAMEKANAKLKRIQHPLSKYSHLKFNPGSDPQMRTLLYDVLELPILDTTDTGLASVSGDTVKKLINHASGNPDVVEVLEAIVTYSGAEKILSTFIPAFENGYLKADGIRYLHGNFNIGGTVSGRLSSSGPNLQNLPSGSVYGKLIKQCFVSPPSGLFIGADFESLEDKISALTTKDSNKLKPYIDGYDGHCLRAFAYFGDQMPDIVDTVESVNSIKEKYPELRQDSKAPTFLLTYGGSWVGLMRNMGIGEAAAKGIENNYQVLYTESIEYIHEKLVQASKDGYVTTAFGLRLRTPLLAQVMYGEGYVPFQAQAEARTAGNALGQGYGMLNSRAAIAFMKRVWDSPYRHDILPCALIHDAIYFIVANKPEVLEWANNTLIEEMSWQELPELQHDLVKLSAELEVFWPNWATPVKLNNHASQAEIIEACVNHRKKLDDPES